MAWTDALSSEGPALPIALALMRMGGRSSQPHNLGNELTTAMQQYQQMKQQQQAAQLRDLQMQQLKMGLLKNKQTEQYGQDYLNSANPQDPNLRYLAQTNPGGLAELLAKQKLQQDQANAEMARFGLGGQQSMPQAPTPIAGAMPQSLSEPQGPVGNFAGDPKQIAAEIMKIQDPVERANALKALNQQFYPQQAQQNMPQQEGMLPSIDKDKAFMMSMSQVPSIAAAGKLILKRYEDQQKAQDALQGRKDLLEFGASLRPSQQPMAPVAYQDEKGNVVWGTINEAKGRPAANYSPTIQGAVAQAKKSGSERGQQIADQPQATLKTNLVIDNLDKLDSAITELSNAPGLSNITGPVAGRTFNITEAATNAQAKLDSIKSQTFVSALQAMREASKTGGAVGNVSDKEGDRLENTLAALGQAQGTEEFKKQLTKAQQQLRLSKQRIKQAYIDTYGTDIPTGNKPDDNDPLGLRK